MFAPVYNNLVMNYMPKPVSGNSTHKASELRRIYSTIVKLNKKSPLYKIELTDKRQSFVLNLKESSMAMNEALAPFTGKNGTSVFDYRKAVSENPESADAVLSEKHATDDSLQPYTLKVNQLAKHQINVSAPLRASYTGIEGGTYRFSIEVNEKIKEFQFDIKQYSSNERILTKLASMINKADLGISANVLVTPDDEITLTLKSDDTGNTGDPIFDLYDLSAPENTPGIVNYYHLDHIQTYPSNAQFVLNGEDKQSMSNTITIDKTIRLALHNLSAEEFQISYQPDDKKILDSLHVMMHTYNNIIELAQKNESTQGTSLKLVRELKGVLHSRRNELEAAGITYDRKTGKLEIDNSLARQAITDGDMEQLFGSDSSLVKGLVSRINYVTINPMNYVDKKLITYPNTSKPGTNASYITSIYSGMLFNYYC